MSKLKYFVMALLALAFVGVDAMAQVTLPSTGIVFADYIAAAVTLIGVGVAAVVGAYFAFKAVKIFLRWAGRIGG